jgi:hypothetical protein
VSIGDGLGLRLLLWALLTAMAIAWVLRYATKVRRNPAASLVAGEDFGDSTPAQEPAVEHRLTSTQKWVLVITGLAFALMIFSVIPWSSIFGAHTGPADDYLTHTTEVKPYFFELNWWFPQLSMLFILACIPVGHGHRLDHGPRPDPDVGADQCRTCGRPGDREGELRQMAAFRVAVAGGPARGGGRNRRYRRRCMTKREDTVQGAVRGLRAPSRQR